MGKIKGENFVNKPERERPASKPASMRRALRAHKRGFVERRTKRGQFIPDTLVFEFTKKTPGHKKGEKICVPLSRFGMARDGCRELLRYEEGGRGKTKIQKKRTVWHDLAVTI